MRLYSTLLLALSASRTSAGGNTVPLPPHARRVRTSVGADPPIGDDRRRRTSVCVIVVDGGWICMKCLSDFALTSEWNAR